MARRFLAGFMSVLMAWSSASSSVGEMSYWKDRRQAVQSRGKTVRRSDIQLAALGAMALPPDGLISSRYSFDVLSESQISFPGQSPPNAPKNPSDAVPESVLKILRALPVDAGTVRTISLPSGSIKGVVIHIQDIHENGEAQANISRAVRNLLDSKTVDLVGLEGAFAPLDLENYRRFPRRETLRLVANDLLARHVISGPVHAGFLSAGSTVPFLGVDQEEHHRRNVDAYRRSVKILDEDQRALNQAAQLLEVKKEAHFSPALRRFDLALHDYRAGKTGLPQHVETLANLAPRLPTQVRIFHEAVDLEKHLDIAQAERERTKVVERLVQSLSENEISDLTVRSAEFRMGRLSRGAFYGFLKHVCKISGLTLESYPAFNDYLTYVLLVQNIRMENLQTDLAQLEQEISHRLARTTAEKNLLEESNRLYFLSSLTNFTLSPNEWDQYKAMDFSHLLPPNHRAIYESFYREAEIRDTEMSNGLLNAMKTRKIHSAVLVAGGFHGFGIQRRLTHQGMAVVDYVPKITKVAEGNGSAYLSVFAQEKTPLEQLFAAEQLFVAKPPMAKTTAFETAGEVTVFENGKPGGMSKEMVALSFLPRTIIARIKKIDVALKKGTSSATYYFSEHAWKFSCVFQIGVPSFSQGLVTDGNRYTEFMAKMGAAVIMAFAVILFQWMLKSVFGLEWGASAPAGPFSWALFYLAGMSLHLFHADPRPTQAGLLQAPFVRYFMGEKITMNPGSLFKKGVYAGSGLDISSYLLSTNCIDSYFLTSDPAVEYESLIELPQIQINNSDTAESWFIEKYRNQKWTVGFSSSDLFEKATPKQVIQVLALELVAIGVDPSRVTVDRNRGYPRIRFPWRYEGEEEKLYSITFVNADVVNPKYYPPLLTELDGIDVFFLKAGFFLPFHFNKYLPWWREKMTDGGFFAIDPHAVPPDSLFDNFSKMVVVPIPPMNGVTSVPLLDEITLTREMMDALETSFNIGLAARLRPWRTKFDRRSPNFTYGHVLKLLKVKNSPRANLTAPNTLERFWSAWNRIRRKEVGTQEMVTQQAPWESYWVAVLAGVTVPILTAFGLSPLWAGMWGAAWGLAHAAGTFDRDLNKISGWKASRTSLAKAAVGLLWVSLYAWGLDALLSQLPMGEYLARFDAVEMWHKYLVIFGILPSVFGLTARWMHKSVNARVYSRNKPPLSYRTANLLARILPWSWITRIVRTGRIETILDCGMPQYVAEVVYYLGRDTGLIYRSYTRPGRLAPVDDLMCYLGVKRTDGPSLLFDVGPGFPPITPNEMAKKTGASVVTFETGQPRYLVTLGTSEHGQSPLFARFNENQELLSVWRYGGHGGTNFFHYLRVREMLKKFLQTKQQPKGGDIRIDPTHLGLNPKTNLDRREGNLFSELQVFPGEKADAIRIANVLWFQDKKKELEAIHKLRKYLHPGGKIYIVDGGAEQMEVMVFENMKDGLVPRFYGMTCLPGTEFQFNENLGTDRHGGRGWLFGPFEKHRQAVSAITSKLAQSSQWSPDSVVAELQKEFPGVTHVGNLYLFPTGGMFELEGTKQMNQGMDANRLAAMSNIMSDLDQHPLASLGVGEKFGPPESLGWAAANFLADQVRRPSFVQGLKNALVERGIVVSNIKAVWAFFASLVPHRAHLFFISRSTELTDDQWRSLSRTLRSRYKPGEGLIVVPQGMDERLAKTLDRFELSQYVERVSPDALVRSPSGVTWVLPLVERGAKIKNVLAQQPLVTLYASPGVSFDRAGVVSDNLAAATRDVKRLLDALESLPLLRTRSEIIGILTRAVQESA